MQSSFAGRRRARIIRQEYDGGEEVKVDAIRVDREDDVQGESSYLVADSHISNDSLPKQQADYGQNKHPQFAAHR